MFDANWYWLTQKEQVIELKQSKKAGQFHVTVSIAQGCDNKLWPSHSGQRSTGSVSFQKQVKDICENQKLFATTSAKVRPSVELPGLRLEVDNKRHFYEWGTSNVFPSLRICSKGCHQQHSPATHQEEVSLQVVSIPGWYLDDPALFH